MEWIAFNWVWIQIENQNILRLISERHPVGIRNPES